MEQVLKNFLEVLNTSSFEKEKQLFRERVWAFRPVVNSFLNDLRKTYLNEKNNKWCKVLSYEGIHTDDYITGLTGRSYYWRDHVVYKEKELIKLVELHYILFIEKLKIKEQNIQADALRTLFIQLVANHINLLHKYEKNYFKNVWCGIFSDFLNNNINIENFKKELEEMKNKKVVMTDLVEELKEIKQEQQETLQEDKTFSINNYIALEKKTLDDEKEALEKGIKEAENIIRINREKLIEVNKRYEALMNFEEKFIKRA